ncbi:unnamed protein product, partial [Ixodes hexagonus]
VPFRTSPVASRKTVLPAMTAKATYEMVVIKMARSVPRGMAFWGSPEMFAPARIPVAAGKKMEKTLKKVSPSLNPGRKFSM